MMSPRFTIKISIYEKPGYASLIEVIVKQRAETVYVASGGDLETVMDAARDAIAQCEEADDVS